MVRDEESVAAKDRVDSVTLGRLPAFNGADPVSAVERKLKGTLIEVDSMGSDSGGAGERFVHAQAVAAVLIGPES